MWWSEYIKRSQMMERIPIGSNWNNISKQISNGYTGLWSYGVNINTEMIVCHSISSKIIWQLQQKSLTYRRKTWQTPPQMMKLQATYVPCRMPWGGFKIPSVALSKMQHIPGTVWALRILWIRVVSREYMVSRILQYCIYKVANSKVKV